MENCARETESPCYRSQNDYGLNLQLVFPYAIGIIGRARAFMDPAQLKLLYNTMVLPHLQYCLINWGNFSACSNIKFGKKILTLQKCLVRIIDGAPRLSHADPLFFSQNSLKIEDLYEQSVRMFAFKLFKNITPNEITNFFSQNHT